MSLRQMQHSSIADVAWRTAFRVGFPLARTWWRLSRPCHEGALVAVYVGRGLLLVRPSYRQGWNLPGGGVRRGEAPEAAARRELLEETGLVAPPLLPACVVRGDWDGRRERVHFFELRLDRLPELKLDNREIIAARLVGPAELGGMRLTGPVALYVAETAALDYPNGAPAAT
jgi:8-oxo-dGTP diphosphatase